jgi:hypothetical protein
LINQSALGFPGYRCGPEPERHHTRDAPEQLRRTPSRLELPRPRRGPANEHLRGPRSRSVWVASGGQFLAAGWGGGVFLTARAGVTVELLPPLRDLDRV